MNSAASSEAGERKMPLSLAEPAGFAETTMITKTAKAEFSPLGMLCRPCELCGLERSGREKNAVVSRRARRVRRDDPEIETCETFCLHFDNFMPSL